MKSLILSKLRLTDDEFKKGAWLFTLFFLLINGIFFGRNARDSIFLVKVGLAYLPYAYMLNAILAIGSAFVYAMFVDKLDRIHLVRIILIVFMVFLGVTYAGLQTEMRWVYWATYSIVQVIWLMSLMMFWTFAADFFDTVQSKRVFPLIGMGGLIGMITSGLVAKPLIRAFGTDRLFIAWAILLGLGLLVIARLAYLRPAAAGKPARKKKAPEASQWQQLLEGFQNVRRTPLLLNMVVLILALWLVFTLIDYQFSQVARARFTENGVTDKDALTAFLGIFRSWAGICCLIFQMFLTPLVIRKLGVAGAMTLHPAFLVFSIGSMALAFGFIPTCVTKFGDHVLLYTATDVAYQLLFNPIPAARRGRARAFVEGYVKPFSMGLGGAFLLLLIQLKLTPAQIAACNFAVTLVWFVSALALRKNYLKAVVSNLEAAPATRALASTSPETSAAVIAAMEKRLTSSQPDEVIFAIEYFALVKHEAAAGPCAALMTHENSAVRRMACRAVADLNGPAALPRLEAALRDADPRVIREALAGIRKLGGEDQLAALSALRLHPDLSIVAESIETAVEVGGFDGILATADMLKAWSKSEDPRELELLASILGRLKIKSFLNILLDLAKHPNEKVSKAAIVALTHFKDDRILPVLVDALRDEIIFPLIQRHLAGLGEKHRNTLLSLYRNVGDRHRVRQRLFEAIAESERWDPSALLIEEMVSEDPVIRFLCVKHLDARETGAVHRDRVDSLLRKELEYWMRIQTLRSSLNGSTSSRAVQAVDLVMDEELHRTRKTAFLALGFLGDRATFRRIYRNMFYGASNERALAMEALENMRLAPWTQVMLALLDGGQLPEARELFKKSFPDAVFDVDRVLQELSARAYDYLLSAILLFWMESRDTSRRPMIESLRGHTSALVREHAEAAFAAIS